MATPSPQSSLPQGFSVYQPALGAQLQFFPALGTPQLDELISAHVPGPGAVRDKRATVSLDFLEHVQRTGQTFKFYTVNGCGSMVHSPVTPSPSLDSAPSSSYNPSPVASSWDWSATASVSSFSSSTTRRRRLSKAASSTSHSRSGPTDLSNLPGMKILTKDGRDVTESASRGSKTKEQRDHAHLMRIIKACDTCRRKKIRCDPSHKRRGAASQPAATASKKHKAMPQAQQSLPPPPPPPQRPQPSQAQQSSLNACPPAAVIVDELAPFSTPHVDSDKIFSVPGLETADASMSLPLDPWEEFIQFPMDVAEDYNYDLLTDPETFFSSESSSPSLESSSKPLTPQQDTLAPPGIDTANIGGLPPTSPSYPFLDLPWSSAGYIDFNLYSPTSNFSEDDRMLCVSSSSGLSQQQQQQQPSQALEYSPSDYQLLGGGGVGLESLGDEAVRRCGADAAMPEPPGEGAVRFCGTFAATPQSLGDQAVGCCDIDAAMPEPPGKEVARRCGLDAAMPQSLGDEAVRSCGTDAAMPEPPGDEVARRCSTDALMPEGDGAVHRALDTTSTSLDIAGSRSSSIVSIEPLQALSDTPSLVSRVHSAAIRRRNGSQTVIRPLHGYAMTASLSVQRNEQSSMRKACNDILNAPTSLRHTAAVALHGTENITLGLSESSRSGVSDSGAPGPRHEMAALTRPIHGQTTAASQQWTTPALMWTALGVLAAVLASALMLSMSTFVVSAALPAHTVAALLVLTSKATKAALAPPESAPAADASTVTRKTRETRLSRGHPSLGLDGRRPRLESLRSHAFAASSLIRAGACSTSTWRQC